MTIPHLTDDEHDAQEALYGPQTRSGNVTPAPLAYSVYDPLARQGWIRPWMDWDSVVWFPVGHSISTRFIPRLLEQEAKRLACEMGL